MKQSGKQHVFNSALYEGTVWHRRLLPKPHDFSYRVFMVYLDLSEIDQFMALSSLWSQQASSWAPAKFNRDHYFFHPDNRALGLEDAVRAAVSDELDFSPKGKIGLLTNLRYFGYLTNPISVYYCFDESGSRLEAILLEVTNTPWGERQHYVLDRRGASQGEGAVSFDKKMHVSPFMSMQMEYQWRGAAPKETLNLSLLMRDKTSTKSTPCFSAGADFSRVPVTRRNLDRALIRFPFMTVKVIASIYWQALKLWLKGITFVQHPDRETTHTHHTQ